MFSRGEPNAAGKAQPGAAGGGGWMSNVFSRVRGKVEEAISPRVVHPSSETSAGRSWASSSGVIRTSELTHFERISLNAMEERVLPPDVRIKIVCAQATAVEQEEELLEADVNRLDGLVRTLALYGVLERNAIDSSKSDKLAPDREQELGKMLVAAVQLELFQMLDDICEAGDMENELFDDLCTDTIQDGRRAGFIFLTAELLLSPGSGYKRLLQIRKDQVVEEIADVAGLRTLGGHDCQRDSSESPKPGSRQQVAAADSDIGSPGSAAGGPGLKITRGARSVSANLSGLSPSPSSQRPDSRSPSPETGHRRSQTQRVRDLLSTIDGLVMESEQPEEALCRMSPLSPSNKPSESGGGGGAGAPRGRSVRGYKRQSTGGMDPRGSRSSRLSLRTPPPPGDANDEEDGDSHRSPSQRAFFPNEQDWRGSPFGATPPPELAGRRRASVIPDPDSEGGENPASADMLLAEVDWLIAGTNAALGKKDSESSFDGRESLGTTPDKREPPRARDDDAPEPAETARTDGDGNGAGRDAAELVDPIGNGGLEVTPDKRELSPRREEEDAPETVGTTRVEGDEGVSLFGSAKGRGDKRDKAEGGGGRSGDGESADSQRAGAGAGAGVPLSSPEEASLTASPSPETRVSSSSPMVASDAESGGGDGAREDESEAEPLSPSVDSAEDVGEGEDGDDSSAKPTVDTIVEIRHEEKRVSAVTAAAAAGENVEEGTEAANDGDILVEGSETLTETEPAAMASSVGPGTVGDSPVEVTVPEDVGGIVAKTEAKTEGQQDEEDEQPTVDAVVESGVTRSDRPTGARHDGDPRSLDPKDGRAELNENDGDRDVSPTGAGGSTGVSDLDDSTLPLKPDPDADVSPEAGEARVPHSPSGGNLLPPAAVPDASEEAAPQVVQELASSGDDLQAVVSDGNRSDLEKEIRSSRGEAVVVVENGAGVEQEAEASTFEDVEL